MSLKRYGILNDIHFPYECRPRYSVALKIFRKMRIDGLYLNGDICEFQAVSNYPTNMAERIDFSKEIAYANKRFDELETLFAGLPVTYLCGNHEHRFYRFVQDLAPQMWGITDTPALLRFPERPGWKFIPYGPSQLVRCGKSNLYLRHEPLAGGMTATKVTAEGSVVDVATGHTHTYQSYTHKKIGPKPVTNVGYTLGWLGDPQRQVFDYRGPRDKWVRGCTLIECDEASGQYTLEFINLEKLPVLYRGEKFTAGQ